MGRTHLQRRMALVLTLVFAADVAVISASSSVAWLLRGEINSLHDSAEFTTSIVGLQPAVAPWLIVLWVLVLLAFGAYDTRGFGSSFDEFRSITVASLVSLGASGSVAYLVKSQLPRGYFLLAFAIGIPALLVARYFERKMLHHRRSRGRLVSRTIAVGSPTAVAELVAVLDRERWTGYHVLGMCGELGAPSVPLLGSLEELPTIAVEQDADAVLVAGGGYGSSADLRRLGWALEGLDLDMLVVPTLLDIAGPRVRFSHVAGLPLVHVEEPRIDEAIGFAKRLFDLAGALTLLTLGLIPMLIVALGIKVQDGGPVFYRQRRVGRQGRTFLMYKFRSMRVGADQMLVDLGRHNESDGVLFKIRNDPRVTKLGKIIRKFSIDELPQLINVVRGEMSLVGPRPPLPDEVEQYDADVHRRLLVRPGITGLWQVSGRSDLSWAESVRLDLYYVDNWSLTGDLMILMKTIRAVLLSHGAY